MAASAVLNQPTQNDMPLSLLSSADREHTCTEPCLCTEPRWRPSDVARMHGHARYPWPSPMVEGTVQLQTRPDPIEND